MRRTPCYFFTVKECDKAIADLQLAKTQLQPDGRNCVTCGSDGHQTFECRSNPVVAMKRLEKLESVAMEAHALLHDEWGPDDPELHELLHQMIGI